MLPKYVVLEKPVGQTPLEAVEDFRAKHPELIGVPLAYAGRLDPMASGQLLVLIGDECKRQSEYHGLDKEYEFEVLIGSGSDTGDVLGLVEAGVAANIGVDALRKISAGLVGSLSLPYPKFSSKTVKGKPLHVWTLEGRLDEIEIPKASTRVHSLELIDLREVDAEDVYKDVMKRVDSVTQVTEESKALGRDFRRTEVKDAWEAWLEANKGRKLEIARFRSISSSGTYMRSLAEEIARRLGTIGLAYSIHRTRIGRYHPLPFRLGFWSKTYR